MSKSKSERSATYPHWFPENASAGSRERVAQFRQWEEAARGWQVWESPVRLEPPFTPFPPLASSPLPVDDGQRSPWWARWRAERHPSPSPDDHAAAVPHLIRPPRDESDPSLREFQLYVPPQSKVSLETTLRFLLSLSACRAPVAFEILGRACAITVQLTCRTADVTPVQEQLRAHFPEVVLGTEANFLTTWRASQTGTHSALVDFGLGREFFRPLQNPGGTDPDVLTPLIGALTMLEEGEFGLLQLLLQATRAPWAETLLQVGQGKGRPALVLAAELASALRQKIATPLFAVVLRVEGVSSSEARAWQIVRALGAALAPFSSPLTNTLIPLSNDHYPHALHQQDVDRRQTHRSGMLWNGSEVTGIVHLPSPSVRSASLQRWLKKTKAAPAATGAQDLLLGLNEHNGRSTPVTLSLPQRTRHLYLIGATGSGKSTLMLNCALQDIQHGHGLAILDPHGELIQTLLPQIPEARMKDVIVFDPADHEYPIGFNILHAHSELEKTLLVSDLVSLFRRYATSFGDQMETVLGNAIVAFLESAQGGSLVDLKRFLADNSFRQRFLATVRDAEVVYYWQKEFPLLRGNPQASLLTRLDTFLRPKPIRHIVGQRQNQLDFRTIMDTRKIFLASLAQGLIGRENSALLGTLLLAKMQQMALSRQDVSAQQRIPFHVYVDEFQELITSSIAAILSGARKYQLSLFLAHQELRQLQERDAEVFSAVLANPATRICFRLSDADARKLADGFSYFEAADLTNLGVGEAIARIERADQDFNLRTTPFPSIDPEIAEQRRAQIIARSRATYASTRERVEAEIAQSRPGSTEDKPTPPPKSVTDTREEQSTVPTAKPSAPVSPPQVPVPKEDVAPSVEPPVKEEKKTAARPVKAPVEAKVAKEAGKGGAQHRYLQTLLKSWGEEKGFRATIEKQVPGGSVDVALEREGQTLGIEISVTNTVEYEVGNIRKCLAGGFNEVIFVTIHQRHLTKVQEMTLARISTAEAAKVHFFLPEEFSVYLEQLAANSPGKEEVIKGYKVKVKYKPLSAEEQQARKDAIAKTVLNAMKRFKDKE